MPVEQNSMFWNRMSVGQRLLSISIGYIFAIAVVLTYTISTIQNQKYKSKVIDLAGRQRMITQIYMKDMLLLDTGHKADPSAALDIFDNTLEALINGGKAVNNLKTGATVTLPRATIAEAGKYYIKEKLLSRRLRYEANKWIKLPKDSPTRREKLTRIRDINAKLLAEANNLVKDMTVQSEATLSVMIEWEIIIGIVSALLGIATSMFFASGITGPLNRCVAQAKSISEGELRLNELPVISDNELGNLAASFNKMVANLRDISSQTRGVTENLNSAAAEIMATTQQQAAGTKEQAAAVQQITSTLEEINQSGAQVSDKARRVATAAQSISETSASGMQAVQDTGKAMAAISEQASTVAENVVMLSEKTQAIGEIIATVNDIAEQSNLVALNAAIEAADAGEEGRRFSVVANEIKNLADQSKEATGQVRRILEDIQKGINTSVMLTEEAVKRVEAGKEKTDMAEVTIVAMSDSINESVNAFQQIVGATNQQQIGLEQATQALHEIRQASQQTAASTGQLKEAASGLNNLGQQLRQLVEKYKV